MPLFSQKIYDELLLNVDKHEVFEPEFDEVFFNSYGLTTYTIGCATLWGDGFIAPTLQKRFNFVESTSYFQVIFRNKSNEIIDVFNSLQEDIMYSKLKYHKHGGLKEAEFNVLYNGDIVYYGDMLIEFILNAEKIGKIYSDSITIKDGMLSITGYSQFNRLDALGKITLNNPDSATLKDNVIYFLNAISDYGADNGDPPVFNSDIKPDKILVDDSIILSSVFFIEKSPMEIINGLAVIGGKVAYGIDVAGDFYFYDQNMIEQQRYFLDKDIVNIDLKQDDGAIINSVDLYVVRQNGEELGLFTSKDDLNSVAIYGKKQEDVNLPFLITADDQAIKDRLIENFFTLEPQTLGKFSFYEFENSLPVGKHAVTNYLDYDKKLVYNGCKDDAKLFSSPLAPSINYTKQHFNYVTGNYAFKFIGQGIVPIIGSNTGCNSLVIYMFNDHKVTVSWVERGIEKQFTINAFPQIMAIKIDAYSIEQLTFSIDGVMVLDSIFCLTNFVETNIGYYEAHEVELVGSTVKTTVQLGKNSNDFIEQTKALKDNAKLMNDLLGGNSI